MIVDFRLPIADFALAEHTYIDLRREALQNALTRSHAPTRSHALSDQMR